MKRKYFYDKDLKRIKIPRRQHLILTKSNLIGKSKYTPIGRYLLRTNKEWRKNMFSLCYNRENLYFNRLANHKHKNVQRDNLVSCKTKNDIKRYVRYQKQNHTLNRSWVKKYKEMLKNETR